VSGTPASYCSSLDDLNEADVLIYRPSILSVEDACNVYEPHYFRSLFVLQFHLVLACCYVPHFPFVMPMHHDCCPFRHAFPYRCHMLYLDRSVQFSLIDFIVPSSLLPRHVSFRNSIPFGNWASTSLVVGLLFAFGLDWLNLCMIICLYPYKSVGNSIRSIHSPGSGCEF
jgi:hypothetical protein